jgi:hypothetical protein
MIRERETVLLLLKQQSEATIDEPPTKQAPHAKKNAARMAPAALNARSPKGEFTHKTPAPRPRLQRLMM